MNRYRLRQMRVKPFCHVKNSKTKKGWMHFFGVDDGKHVDKWQWTRKNKRKLFTLCRKFRHPQYIPGRKQIANTPTTWHLINRNRITKYRNLQCWYNVRGSSCDCVHTNFVWKSQIQGNQIHLLLGAIGAFLYLHFSNVAWFSKFSKLSARLSSRVYN